MTLTKASTTSIVNDALARLGSTERVRSINEDRTVALAAKAVWDGLLQAEFDFPWNFAIARAKLNAHADAPAFGYSRQFKLPADCLRWLPPVAEDGTAYFEGEEEGGFILTNAEAPLLIRYISKDKAEDVGSWPASFVQFITYALAYAMAEPVTQSQGIKDRMEAKMNEARTIARRRDASSSPRRSRVMATQRSPWLASRGRPYVPGER